MKLILLAVVFCIVAPLGLVAQDKADAHKIGGAFAVDTAKGLAYREGKDADPVRHKLDIYTPKGQKNFPVLMFVHGGTWKSGNKELYAPLGQLLAKNGIGTVIINYRLSPAVKHPAHIEDVAKAFAWTHKNIAKYGGNPNNFFVCGHSAGGHLVSLLSTNETYLKAEKLAISNIKGTIPISGVFVLLPTAQLKDVFTEDKDIVKSATPIEFVKGKHPPSLMIYADKEIATLDVQAELMCKKLLEAKCEAQTLKIDNRTHTSIIVNMANEADPATQAVFGFLAKHGGLKLQNVKK
ncbi:MAG TPA: alpha/beta hydrolase [Gemmataceae bacterium]|nr:alpha/beta hydrolase [Gemmataceae bacterium]